MSVYVFDIEQFLYKYTFLLSFPNIFYLCVDIKGTVARKEKKRRRQGRNIFSVLTDRGKGEGSCFNGSNVECSCCNVLIRDLVLRLKSANVIYGLSILCEIRP
jgi:hypothetical protein